MLAMMVFLYAHKVSRACELLQSFSTLQRITFFPVHCLCVCHFFCSPPSFPGGLIDCVFCVRSGVKQTCWREWLNNQLSFLTAPNELHRSRGLKAISPLLPHLWTQLVSFLPFALVFLQFLFFFLHSLPCSLCSVASDCSACCYIITNAQIMSPLSLIFSLNNRSKTSRVTFASECCQSRFSPSLLKKLWEEAARSNDSDDWSDQMWACTRGTIL